MTETKEIVLKDCYTKELSKGFNAVIIGQGKEEYFAQWKQSEQAAETAIKEIVGQAGIRMRVHFEIKGEYKNWTKCELLGEKREDFQKASDKYGVTVCAPMGKPPGVKTHQKGGKRPEATDPEKEKEIAEAYKLREREALVIDMAYYLSVAKDAWMDAIHPFDGTTTSALDATDKEAIEKIAVHLRMNKRGR